MQICRQGNGHYLDGLNNQDFFFREANVMLITDGLLILLKKIINLNITLMAQIRQVLQFIKTENF